MTFPYVMNVDDRHVRVVLAGTVIGRDISETIEAIYSDPLWQTDFDVVWDGTGITSLHLEKDDQTDFVNLQLKFEDVAGRGRDILVAPRDLDFNMGKMYAMRLKGAREVHVVRTEVEANLLLSRTNS